MTHRIRISHAAALVAHAVEHGGFTACPDTFAPLDLKNGYMVSSVAGEARVDMTFPESKMTAVKTAVAIQRVLDLIGNATGWYVGGWIDDDGRLCIDASERVPGLERAIATGRARSQDAIYQLPTDTRPGRTIAL